MQIEFSVGAKAARLIGRENIADVDGALVELIKNAYDADASCVWVDFDLPFPDVPDTVELSFLKSILAEEDFIKVSKYYDLFEEGSMEKKENLTEQEKCALKEVLFSYNRIVVLDNGSGMNRETVKSSWMYIGTNNKETQSVSPKKGRIRTGAKGIGRFALDKLSTASEMYTQEENMESALCWKFDWDQFATARLISEVKASLDDTDRQYEDIVKELMGKQFAQLASNYDWTTGTAIILGPTREAWDERLLKKVLTNLKSINPIGSVDEFDVVVHNKYLPEFDYKTEKVAISEDDYDYRITVSYDGDMSLQIKLFRNEVDINKRTVVVTNKIGDKTKSCSLKEFWSREKLQNENYKKEDYNREIIIHKNVTTLFKTDKKDRVREVGPFTAELYFLRNANNEYQIMKRVAVRNRKNLLSQFSGVKIYRDDFKVRPYGDEGPQYDWIGMGVRAQKSGGASVSHSGSWRVEPYQMIGFVRISREDNPLLSDMANREGIALTTTYYIFVDMLQECLKEFEADRQFIYREYAKWIKEQEDTLQGPTDKVKAAALQKANEKKENSKKQNEEKESSSSDDSTNEENKEEKFTEDDYLDAVYNVMKENEKDLNSKQILQVLSSSGIVLNTFFHEFNAINTQFHVRTNQLKSRFDYLLNGEEYQGIAAYNPYRYAEQTLEKNDRLVAALLDVIMDGLKKNNLVKKSLSLKKLTAEILSQWSLLLAEKHIAVSPEQWDEEDCVFEVAVVDWYIILNNFLLNAAWFLEQEANPERKVFFSFEETEKEIYFYLENNGPALDAKFNDNRDRIFELGETSKGENGTGLGLWVVKETVERYGGTINVLDKEEGFGLRIALKKS